MKTRMKMWADYRREINNNAQLQQAVTLANEKLTILRKRILKIMPTYEKKYPTEPTNAAIKHTEMPAPPTFSLSSLHALEQQLTLPPQSEVTTKAIDKLDFSSHELDHVLKEMQARKIAQEQYFAFANEQETIMTKPQKITISNNNLSKRKPSIAIDGPSGSGKSTIAKRIAKKYHLTYINTGLVYRAIALNALNTNTDLHDQAAVQASLVDGMIKLLPNEVVLLHDQDVTKQVRSDQVSINASVISAYPGVRTWAIALQTSYANHEGIIMDGRDTTFRILPHADVKIFLDTSAEERARRRVDQNLLLGFSTNYEEILREINTRDKRDKERTVDPLHQTADATLIDATQMAIEEVVAKISTIIDKVVASWSQ